MFLASSIIPVAVLFDAQLVRWVVWVGLVVFTVALLVLVRTRWGHSQPLGKCIVLSLLAHLLIGIYATTVNIVTATVGSPDGKGIQVALIDSSSGDAHDGKAGEAEPWNALGGNDRALAAGAAAALAPLPARPLDLAPAKELQRQPARLASLPAAPPLQPVAPQPAEDAGPPELALSKTPSQRTAIASAAPLEPPPSVKTPADDVPPPDPAVEPPVQAKPAPRPRPTANRRWPARRPRLARKMAAPVRPMERLAPPGPAPNRCPPPTASGSAITWKSPKALAPRKTAKPASRRRSAGWPPTKAAAAVGKRTA